MFNQSEIKFRDLFVVETEVYIEEVGLYLQVLVTGHSLAGRSRDTVPKAMINRPAVTEVKLPVVAVQEVMELRAVVTAVRVVVVAVTEVKVVEVVVTVVRVVVVVAEGVVVVTEGRVVEVTVVKEVVVVVMVDKVAAVVAMVAKVVMVVEVCALQKSHTNDTKSAVSKKVFLSRFIQTDVTYM